MKQGCNGFIDIAMFQSVFNQSNDNADLDGDGSVNFLDFAIMVSYFLRPSGPLSRTESKYLYRQELMF